MDCVSSGIDVYQMEKFNFEKPIKVTCVFEDSDSDENIVENAQCPESIPVQDPSSHNTALKDLLSTPPIDNYCYSNVCSESIENTLDISHERLNSQSNCNKNMQNSHAGSFQAMPNLQSSSRENHANKEKIERSNYQYRTGNERDHYLNMFDTISETLIRICKYYHYYSTKYKKDHHVKEEYMNRKNEHFSQIYHLSLSLLVPQEHNHAFIRSFIHRTIDIAHHKQWHHHMNINSLQIIVGGLILWTKQKKKYLESCNNDATPTAMPVLPISNTMLDTNTRQPMCEARPVSTASVSHSYLNTRNPPPYHSCHDVLSPTVPLGSTFVETMNKDAPIATPAQFIPRAQTQNSRFNVDQQMNEVSNMSQLAIPASNSGFNIQQHMNIEASLPSIPTYNSAFNVQHKMNGGSTVAPLSNSIFDLHINKEPQAPTSNNEFNHHQINGAHSGSTMTTLNSRLNLQPHTNRAPPEPISNSGFNVRHLNGAHSVPAVQISNAIWHSQQMNGALSIPPTPTSNCGFFEQRQINRSHYISAAPTSNIRFNVQHNINEVPCIPPIPTSYSDLNVQHQKNGAAYIPPVPASSGYNIQRQINEAPYAPLPSISNSEFNVNRAHSILDVSTCNSGFNIQQQINITSPISPVATSNTIFNAQQRINDPPAVSPKSKSISSSNGANNIQRKKNDPPVVSPTTKSNRSSNGAKNIQRKKNDPPVVSPTTKTKSESNGRNNSKQRKNSQPAISPTTKTKGAPNGTNSTKPSMNSAPAISPTIKSKSAFDGTNNVQQQMNGAPPEMPISGPQPLTNLPQPASNNIDINEEKPVGDPDNAICLFSTGLPGREISISIDRAVVNTVILERVHELSETASKKRPKTINDSDNPKKTFKRIWHPPSNDAQESIQTHHTETQLNTENGENMNRTNQLETSLEASQNNKDKVSCEIPFTARSVSRDSGFGSPILSAMQSDNNTVHPNCADNQGLPEITYVTSLNPNASYNDMGFCKICGSLTKKMCLRCYKEYYCGFTCQEIDWPHHMEECRPN